VSETSKETLRELAGSYLLDFPILDNSIASLFSSVFGARTNSVEIFYGNLTLQSRLDCIDAFCGQDAFPFDDEEKKAIKSIVTSARESQQFRNLLAHHFILDTEIIVRGRYQPPQKHVSDPEKLFVWKTNRKGRYNVKPITKKQVQAAIQNMLITSTNISILCARIRMQYGLRP
jgi:hypothetical protein